MLELSSNFQPVTSMELVPVLVNSNQSAATGELPLLQGATSVIKILLVTGVSLAISVTAKV